MILLQALLILDLHHWVQMIRSCQIPILNMRRKVINKMVKIKLVLKAFFGSILVQSNSCLFAI